MNISKKNGKGKGGKTGSKGAAVKLVEEDVHDYFCEDGDEIDGEVEGEEGEGPSLDALPYREELAMCSPEMRELEEGVAEDMAEYMEERI